MWAEFRAVCGVGFAVCDVVLVGRWFLVVLDALRGFGFGFVVVYFG